MKNNLKKRVISLVLAIAMMVSTVPSTALTAFAEGLPTGDAVVEEIQSSPTETPLELEDDSKDETVTTSAPTAVGEDETETQTTTTPVHEQVGEKDGDTVKSESIATPTPSVTPEAEDETAGEKAEVSSAVSPEVSPSEASAENDAAVLTEDVVVDSVSLNKAEMSLVIGKTGTLKATLSPEDATDSTVIWISSDETVAKVEEGVVTGVKAGTATVTATAGGQSAECKVKVTEVPRLASLNVSKVWSDSGDYYTLTPAFDPAVTEYSLSLPDYTGSVFPYAKLAEGTEGKGICYRAYNSMFGSFVWSSSNNVNVSGGYFGAVIYDKSNGMSNEDIRYTVTFNKIATLKSLTVDGVGSLDFNRDTTEGYHYYVDSTKEGVNITASAYKNNYTVTVNGTAVTDGEAYCLPYSWEADGKMTVEIKVSGDKITENVYTLILEKQPLNDTPYIMTQPVENEYTVIDTTVEPLFVQASANGAIEYQWYYNTTDSNENGTRIDGADAASFVPPITTDVIGTRYYYCTVTNTEKTENNTAVSKTARITVDPDPTPKAVITNPGGELNGYTWNTGYVYNVGDTTTPLQVTASADAQGGEFSYRWYAVKTPYNVKSYSTAAGTNNLESYSPPAELKQADSTGKYYGCRVTYTFKGKTYTSWATTGAKYTEGEGESAKTYDVNGVYVFIKVNEAQTPSITKQPVSAGYIEGDAMKAISVTASKTDGGTLTYQWYVNDTNSNENGTAIEGATSKSYKLGTADEGGTKYYYCVVTNTIQGYTSTAVSETAEIKITALADLISDKLYGTGTHEDPILIENTQDYQDISDLIAAGVSFEGMYLKQTGENITLPENWTPIGVSKTRFSGTLDGNNKTVTVPKGEMPLFGYVNGATIKNLNIYGEQIKGYGLVNNLEGVGYSGEAVCIDNVTLKSGTSTLKAGLIGTYITTNGFAGCSAAYYVTIKNCTVEKNVVVGYAKDQSMIGSIAGRVHGTIENCTSYATVYGKDYVGGILGTRDNAMGGCVVTNCRFYGTVEAGGQQAGGIAGGGYSNSSAPNGAKIVINDCSVEGTVTGADKVGGIIGGDSYVMQLWGTCTLKNNSFKGAVKATSGTDVGGIIGYYASLNKYDDISGNYYAKDCGADRGIGFVQYIDTNCATHETASGTIYTNTENGSADIAGMTKTGLNRTDDPLGADAAKLCYTDTDVDPIALELKVSGDYKTEYIKGDKLDLSGIVLTVVYNIGESKILELSDVTVEGYKADKVGNQELTISYNGLTAAIVVAVRNPAGNIDITVSVLGDNKHNSDVDGKVHTLATKNLTTWVEEKNYTVDSNATVWDVLQKVFGDNGMTCSNPTGNYIESVTYKGITLAELDNGGKSGWMYKLNGEHSLLGVSEQFLNNGDEIVFHYTDDYELDENSGDTINVEVTISNKGDVVMKQETVAVTDRNGDGKYNVDEVLYAAHEKAYTSGAKFGYASYTGDYGLSLGTLWGDNSGLFGYYLNNISCQSLADEVAEGDNLVAFVYKNSDWSDKYSHFDSFNYSAANELSVALKYLSGYGGAPDYAPIFSALSSATVAVYDSNGNKVDASTYTVTDNNDGTYKIEFKTEGVYTLVADVTNSAELTTVPAVCKATVLSVARDDNFDKVYKAAGDYLEALAKVTTPTVSSTGGEWVVLGLARSGRSVPTGYYNNVEKYIKENIDEKGRLHWFKSTDNSRVILALTALGIDPIDVAVYNLVTALGDIDYVKQQGINGPIWALIALDSHNYEISSNNDIKDELVAEILAAQLVDGGWALSGDSADVDMTAMAVQALVPYYKSNTSVKAAVDKAVNTLSAMQNKNGTFSTEDPDSGNIVTSESVSQVVVALTALGINPDTDYRFVKNGVSALDALLAFAVNDGKDGFRHLVGGTPNGMATEQAYYALVSYDRMLNDKTSLYDMSDVNLGSVSQEEKDAAAAAETEKLISNIGEVKLENYGKIEKARNAYDKLTDKQKKLVDNYNKLIEAEDEAIDQVEDLIDKIGEVGYDSLTNVEAAKKAYNYLPEYLQKKVSNYDKLKNAEITLKDLCAEAVEILSSGKLVLSKSELLELVDSFEAVTENTGYDAVLALMRTYSRLGEKQQLALKGTDGLKLAQQIIAAYNHTDASTGIKTDDLKWNIRLVVEDAEGDTAEKAIASAIENGTVLEIWNIYLEDVLTGERYSVDKAIEIKIPTGLLGDDTSYDELSIVYYAEDGSMELYNCEVVDGYVVFNAADFNIFAAVGIMANEEVTEETVETEQETDAEEIVSAEQENGNNWLVWGIITAVGVAALFILFAMKKRTKNEE